MESQLVQEEVLEDRELGSQRVLLLAALRVGAMWEVLRVHVGAGLAWPEWDCRCRQKALWEVGAQSQVMVPEWVRPVGMIGRFTCWFDWDCRWRLVRYGFE